MSGSRAGYTPRKRASRRKTLVAVLVLCLAAAAVIAYSTLPRSEASQTNTIGSTSASTSVSGYQAYSVVPSEAHYPSQSLELLYNFTDHANMSSVQSDLLDTEYDSLFSPSFFNSSGEVSLLFALPKNSQIDQSMYSGQENATYLLYPAQFYFAVQGNLLLVYANVADLYGSPYGNATNRGDNQLTLYMRAGSVTYGFGQDSDMFPGVFGDDLALNQQGQPFVTSEGYDVYGFNSYPLANETFYTGPVDSEYQYGPASYDSQSAFQSAGVYWSGSVILGNAVQPTMTRYLFAMNSTALGFFGEPIRLVISLQTSSTYPIGEATPTHSQFETLVDNLPDNQEYSPVNFSDYILLSVPSVGPSSPALPSIIFSARTDAPLSVRGSLADGPARPQDLYLVYN